MDDVNKQELHGLIGRQFDLVFRIMGRGDHIDCRKEWWSLITHHAHPFANFGILSDPSDEDAAHRLSGILAAVNRPAGIMFPGMETAEVRRSLESRGFQLVEQMPAMALDLVDWKEPVCPEGYTIRTIDLDQEGESWVEAMCEGYEVPIPVGAMFGHQHVPEGMSVKHYAAFRDERMVATSMAFFDGSMGGGYCVATRKEDRNRGLGEAITGVAASGVRDCGSSRAVLQASRVATSIYSRMGFVSAGTLPFYVRSCS